MCGLAGFIGRGNNEDLGKMIAAISYRGPDDTGIFCEKSVGLAHARLSILDLSPLGHQPMWNEGKNVAVVFNGEVYNFISLRQELEKKGYRFKSVSDTEVILALYEEYDEKCFEKMNGMFAIALYDFANNKLLLARDRFGKKPLYYGDFSGTFLFASEPKAFFSHPSFEKKIDPISLSQYFLYEYVPTPRSIYEGVSKLAPGTYLVLQNGKIRREKFWQPDLSARDVSIHDAERNFEQLIEESVQSRLVADVPVGIFLSGGLDSSTIAYYAAKNASKKIQTFSIGFSEKDFDESSDARKVAKHIGSEHFEVKLGGKELLGVIPRIFSCLDEPFADPSIIPTFLLSEFARKRVTVALGGDGGDELFAGYPTFQAEKYARLYEKIPEIFKKRVIEPFVRNLPSSEGYFSLDFKAKRFIKGMSEKGIARHILWLGCFSYEEQRKLFSPDFFEKVENENIFKPAQDAISESGLSDSQQATLFAYLRTYLMDQVMVKVDRASMFNSLETRSPFLDYKIVEFAFRLPYKLKLHGTEMKYFLKKSMEGKLPSDIIYKKKQGFAVPLSKWLRNELREMMEETLSRENVEKIGFFNFAYIEKLKKDHLSGQSDNRKELWVLIAFFKWYQFF